MVDFVLVHGAWHGGWCWERVAPALEAAGHRVFRPSLEGLAEDAASLHPGVSLSSHIAQIAALLEREDLAGAVLCGHSYGGMVIEGVADRMPERIAAMVFLDAIYPKDGDSMFSLTGIDRDAFLEARKVPGVAYAMSPPSGAFMGLTGPDAAWVDRLCTPHPVASFDEPIQLTGASGQVHRRVFVVAEKWGIGPMAAMAETLRGTPGWTVLSFPGGHELMIDCAPQLTALLLQAAAG